MDRSWAPRWFSRLWHKRSGRNELLVGHQGRVFGVDFSDDGKHLASASEDQTVRVWDLEQLTQSACFQHPVRVNAVRFCGAGRVASAAGDQILRLWALHGEKELRKLVGHEGPSGRWMSQEKLVLYRIGRWNCSALGRIGIHSPSASLVPRFTR